MSRKVEKITVDMNQDRLPQDLERYRQQALELGATQAKIVQAANEGGMSEEEIRANQLQIDSAVDSITRIANTTSFAGRMLLNGSLQYSTSGVQAAAITAQQVNAAQFGTLDSLAVDVHVTSAARRAQLTFPYTALNNASAITIEIRGATGVTSLSFGSATPASTICKAIKSVADATGVSATLSTTPASGFRMWTRGYGSDEFVSVRVLGPTGYFGGTTREEDAKGADARATINGCMAAAEGNHVAVKTSTFDLEVDLKAGWASTTSYTITGGGALFQVGPHVNSELQVNIGVQSMTATSRMMRSPAS